MSESSFVSLDSYPPAVAEACEDLFVRILYGDIRRAQADEEFMRRFKKWKRARRKAGFRTNGVPA